MSKNAETDEEILNVILKLEDNTMPNSTNFEELTEDEELRSILKKLYGSIDHLEAYVLELIDMFVLSITLATTMVLGPVSESNVLSNPSTRTFLSRFCHTDPPTKSNHTIIATVTLVDLRRTKKMAGLSRVYSAST